MVTRIVIRPKQENAWGFFIAKNKDDGGTFMKITGAKHFVKALKFEGVDTIFAYPGGYVNDIFDELTHQEDIKLVLPRHEQALVHEADGYARATKKAGVCIVTSGPGATNIVTSLATAMYDSVPLVCFTGQVPREQIGNDAFQEVDIVGITRSVTKHSVLVKDRDELPRILKEAFYIATTGRPGPVLVDLPADVMKEIREEHFPKSVNIRSYKPNTGVHIGQLKRAITELKKAKRPIFLIGGGVTIAGAQEVLRQLVEKTKVPVITTIMGKGAIPSDHEFYIGNSGMHGCYACNMALEECDLIFSIGARFSDRTTGNLSNFAPKAKIVHIDIDTASISRTVKVDIPIVADAKLAIEKMLPMAESVERPQWIEQIKNWQKQHPLPKWDKKKEFGPRVILEEVNKIEEDMIVVTDVGQHQMWTTQYLEMKGNRSLIMSGGLGTMGYGFPAAIGSAIGCPNKRVLCITGDGGFQMNMQEMATAVCYGIPVTVILMNNHYLGMVRQMQELFFNQRYSLTRLKGNKSCTYPVDLDLEKEEYVPDFVTWAKSYHVKGFRVKTREELVEALNEAKTVTDRPTLIECMISPEELVYPMVKSGTSLYDMILEEQ